MSDETVISALLGRAAADFRGPKWPEDPAVFHSDREWFRMLSSIAALGDSEEWLDRATVLMSFRSGDVFGRAEARRRYRDGESIYILGLERTVKPIRDLCDGLA